MPVSTLRTEYIVAKRRQPMEYTFKDVEFMTAKDKKLVLQNWIRFLKSLANKENQKDAEPDKYGNVMPMAFHAFPDRLYKHLSLHCGFIAHYDRWGFYQTYFSGDMADMQAFFSHFEQKDHFMATYPTVSCWGDYEDIGRAMCDEYLKIKDKIDDGAEKLAQDRLSLLSELVNRAKTDKGLRDQLLNKIGVAV